MDFNMKVLFFTLFAAGQLYAVVTPELNCVEKITDTKYRAWFGFTNTGTVDEKYVIGLDNKFTGGGVVGEDQGQLRVFKPGSFSAQFSIVFDGTDLTWILNGKTAVARGNSTCPENGMPSEKQPNFTKVTTYSDDGNSPLISTTYTDGLGRVTESQIKLYGKVDADALVTDNVYDNTGRLQKTYLPAPAATGGGYVGIESVESAARVYYGIAGEGGNAEGFHYFETEYSLDPLGRVVRKGGPGREYSIDGNPAQYWYFGTKPSGAADRDLDGFLKCTALTKLVSIVPSLPANVTDATHYLSVVCNSDGSFSQTITDVFGRKIKTWANTAKPPIDASSIITSYMYDVMGNIISETPPGINLVTGTVYRYNKLSQLIYKNSADGAILKYQYNDAGLLSSVVSEDRKGNIIRTLVYNYDGYNRLETIGWQVTCGESNYIPLIRYFYDNVTNLAVCNYDRVNTNLPHLENYKGRVVASVSYGYTGSIPSCSEAEKQYVIDLFSYDNEGRVVKKIKIIPGVPETEINFQYDIQSKIKREIVKSKNTTIVKFYNYDEFGRLQKIIQENDNTSKILSSYQYDLKGKLKYWQTGAGSSYTVRYEHDIQGKLTGIKAPFNNLFEETIDYGNLHNGNISNARYHYKMSTVKEYTHSYIYDGLNRLTDITVINGVYPIPGEGISAYQYDPAGRFKSKKEGTSDHPSYQYYSGTYQDIEKNENVTIYTNRLKTTKGIAAANRFLYDEFGNCIIDFEKKMLTVYDWRNLPISFYFFSSFPSEIKADFRGTAYIDDMSFSSTDNSIYSYMIFKGLEPISIVSILYDAAGSRVLKISD